MSVFSGLVARMLLVHRPSAGSTIFLSTKEVMMRQLITAIALAATSVCAWAGDSTGVIPEPGVLPLLAIGAVGGLVLWARNRNKKK
jgi:uncharacterized protein involved in response to NO